jgi:lipopolysaccharide transport system ATP-binding protein
VIHASISKAMDRPIIGFLLRDKLGQDLFGENTLPFTDQNPISVLAGSILEASFTFRLPMLPNGEYTMMASLADGDLYNHVQHHWMHDALMINVFSSKVRWGLVGVEFSEVELRKAHEVIN